MHNFIIDIISIFYVYMILVLVARIITVEAKPVNFIDLHQALVHFLMFLYVVGGLALGMVADSGINIFLDLLAGGLSNAQRAHGVWMWRWFCQAI